MKRAILLIIFSATPASALDTGRLVLPDNAIPTHYDVTIRPDAEHMTFQGDVKIALDLKKPTKTIVLNAADLIFKKVSLSGQKAAPPMMFDATAETATLTFAHTIKGGKHTLAIAYSGKINPHAAGLFALDYDTAIGKQRALFTQFENSDARRFMPCWDEPNRKASFSLSAIVPAGQFAVSNMPVASTVKLPHDLKRVRFARTPKMSTYLLFFGLGDLERISKTVNGVDVGIVFKRGDAARASYALDAATHILPYYEDYFGVKFPLPKLDLIAGPGQSQFFGAMENWGAIFYFERALLIDPKVSTEGNRRGVYTVIAHEMAHQWFGDLVTMDWWDDLWLNEGFASWMETKATDNFNPEWNLWIDALDAEERAMSVDARTGTHPIVAHIRDVLQAHLAFDTITYEKGAAVIRMLEQYSGADAFRDGIRRYMKAHAYANTVTDDLWHELDRTAPSPISSVAHDFTLQAGVPLVRVTQTPTGVHLEQDRFADDVSGKEALTWRVPVTEMVLGSTNVWHGIVSRSAPADIAVAAGEVPIVNAGQTGYFRTFYSPTLFDALEKKFLELSAADELGVLNDSFALGFSGYEPLANFLELASQAKPGMEPQVLRSISMRLEDISRLYRGLKGETAFLAFGRSVLEPLVDTLGWEDKTGESQNTRLLRNEVLGALSALKDPAIIGEARTRYAHFIKDPSSLSGNLRHSVLLIVAMHADEATWEQLRALAGATNNSLEQRELYALLGEVRDPALAERTLELALNAETPITVRPSIISVVARYYPELAFNFATAHLNEINAMIEPTGRNQFEPRLVRTSVDPAMIERLQKFADANIPEGARGDVSKSEAAIAFNARVRAQRLPEVDAWVRSLRL